MDIKGKSNIINAEINNIKRTRTFNERKCFIGLKS